MRRIIQTLALLFATNVVFATTYYSRNTAGLDLSNTANWTTAASGSGGTSPSNFTTAGDAFIVQNATSFVVSSTLNISGSGSTLTIGNGTTVALTVNAALSAPTISMSTASTVTANAAISGTFNMTGTASLVYNVATGYPTFNTIASTTTVNFAGTSINHVIPAATYGNLTISSTGTTTFMNSAATSTWAVAGNLLFSSAGTVNVCNVSTGTANATLNVTGTFSISSTGTFNVNASSGGTANAVMAVTGTTSFSSTGTLNINNCSGGTTYARLTVTPAFSMTTAAFINVNKATGGTPVGRLTFSSTYSMSAGTVTVGSATSGVTTNAYDTLSVAGATVGITGGTFNIGASGATNNTNVFTATSATLTLSTGTLNVGSNSAGTGSNVMSVNALTFTSGSFNGGAATGGTNTNTISVAGAVSHTTTTVRLNSASAGTTTTVMSVGTTYGLTSSGTLAIQVASGGSNNYARLDVTGAFSASLGTLTINGASGGTSPVGRLRCLSTYTTSGSVAVSIGNSTATTPADTIDVAGAVAISNTTTNIGTGTGTSAINRFICGTTFTFSTGTFNMCNQTAGSSNNYLTINGSGGTAMTLTSGTFNGGFASATSGTFNDTISVTSATGDVSISTCVFSLNKPSSTNTSNAAFLIGRRLTYTSTGSITLNSGTNGTATSYMSVGDSVALASGTLNAITATGGTTTSTLNIATNVGITTGQMNGISSAATAGTPTALIAIGGNVNMTSSGQMNVNAAAGATTPRAKITIGGNYTNTSTGSVRVCNVTSATSSATDSLVITGNVVLTGTSATHMVVSANNCPSSNNTLIIGGTYAQSAGTNSICANTGGGATNGMFINSAASPCMTLSGTAVFNVCASTTATPTLVNKLNLAGGFLMSAGTFRMSSASVTGTINDTMNITGTATISGGTFNGGAGFGVQCVNFNNTSASCLSMSGTSAMSLMSSVNSGNVTFTCAGSFSSTSTGTSINMESGGSASGVSVFQVNGNATFNCTSGTYMNWGTGTTTGDYFGVTGNLSFSGGGTMTSGTTQPLGFVFNGSGTSGAPQFLSYSSTVTPSWGPIYVVNSGTYVKLQSNIALPINTSPYSIMTVNSGGTLDCSTYTVSGGAASGTTGLQLNGTLATANTAGVNGSVTTTVRTIASNANFIFNGSSAQVTGTYMPVNTGSLTISNSAGVTLSQNDTLSGTLTLTSGVLNTSSYTLAMSGSGTVTGAGSSSYVNGNFAKTISGLSTVVFEVGDATYAPVSLALTGASAGYIVAKSTTGAHPQIATSGVTTSNYTSHYWTLANGGATLTGITPTFTYNLADIIGGSNTGFSTQKYFTGSWLGSALSTTNTASPYTSMPSGITSGAFAGDYIVGLKVSPSLTAAAGATVDNPFNITFTDDATWRSAITTVKVGTNVLPGAAYSVSTAGQITLTPAASVYLQTAGTFVITVLATGYADATVSQTIAAGVATHLAMVTNPGDAVYGGGPLSTQPVVSILDQYNNVTTSTATVTATVGAGSWTIGGTTGVAGVAGVATYSGLTATAASYVTGATITFSSGSLTPVTSASFNVPAPSPVLTAASGATVDNPFSITFTDDATWRSAITAIKIGTNTLPGAAYSISAGTITLDPSASAFLQTAGTYTITVIATTYGADPVVQYIGPGVATHLAITTQPTAPLTNPGNLNTQPVVSLKDQYENLASTSSSTISAAASGATWTLGGTTSAATSGGVATYTDLTGAASVYTTGATITFSASGFTSVVSNTFNIPYPYGTFTYGTGGTFATLADAITALDTIYFGGPIILNAAVSGWTETAPAGGYRLGSALMNSSLNAVNTLTINGYPGGAHTVITAPTGTGSNDCIFSVLGSDYVTINGIDLQESGSNTTATTKMEYGYAFFNLRTSTPADGCRYDQVKNCIISLDRTNTNSTYGIASVHKDTNGTTATITDTIDLHSNNKFYTNTISNCQYPIYLAGYNASTPYSLYDQNNDVGGSAIGTGNNATNWGATGGPSGMGAGVTLIFQNNANASYNTLDNASSGATNINSLYGVYCSGVNSTFTANRNTITLNEQSGSTSNYCNGIHAESAGSNLTANNNTITINETSGSNVTTNGIFSATSVGNNLTAKNNIINITMSLSGSNDLSGIYSNSTGVVLFQSNTVTITNSGTANSCITTFYRTTGSSGGTLTMNYNTATGTNINTTNNLAGYGNTTNATTLKINNNTANITCIASTGTIISGVANSGINGVQESNNNNFTITASSLNSGTPAGIYNIGGATTSLSANYDTISVSANNASGAGIYNANTTNSATGSFNYNVINVNMTAAGTGQAIGIYNNNGLMTTQSISNNTVTLNTYTGGGAAYGIASISGAVATGTISYNTITASTTTGSVNGIYTSFDASMLTPNINYNTIDLSMSGASASAINYIYYGPSAAPATGGTQNINFNNFKSASGFPNNTGNLYMIENLNYSGSTNNITNNYTTGAITKTGNGGAFYGIYSRSITLATGYTTITNNSFKNINVGSTNAVSFWGIIAGWNTGIPENISYNTFDSITCGTNPSVMIQTSTYGSGSLFNYNRMSNVTGAGTGLYGICISTVGSGGTGTAPGSAVTGTAFGGTFQGNKVNDFTNSNASGVIYPYYLWYNTTTATSTFDFYQDTAYNLTVTGGTSPAIYGMYEYKTQNLYKLITNVRNSIFHDFTCTNSTANATITGLYYTWVDSATVSNNLFYNLSTGSATGTSSNVTGINLVSKNASSIDTAGYFNIYNNTMTDFTAPAANNPNSIYGIRMQSLANNYWNLYHNTIAFGGLGVGSPGTALSSSGTNFGVAALLFPPATTSVLTLTDNILYVNANPSGTGIAACLQRNTTGTAGTAPSSSLFIPNYNIYYTNSGASAGATPNNFIYVDDFTGGAGTIRNGYATNGLTASGTDNIVNDANFNSCPGSTYATSYKTFIGGGNETYSYSECNLTSSGFATGSCGPSGSSFAYNNGIAITSPSITTDQSGTTRLSPPCRGAKEFSGSAPSSGAPPVLSYTPILATSYCIANAPTLSAVITSSAGINVTSGTKPRMYYRGSGDANALGATNDNTTDGWKYVEASNSSSPFTFQPDYTLLNHTVSAGTTIYYFVIAQDNSGSPLVGYSSAGFQLGYCPSSVALGSGAFPTTASPTVNSYNISSLPSFTISVSPSNYYGSSNPATLTLSPSNSDLGLQWQMSYVATSGTTPYASISGATTNGYSATMPDITSSPALASPGTSNNVSFQALLTCNLSVVSTVTATSVTDYTPQILSTTGGSRCGTGAVTLSATGSTGSNYYWYANATGGSALAAGASYSPTVSATTTFYVSDSFGTYGAQTIGKADILSSGTNNLYSITTGSAGDGLFFTANKDIKINSVNIYPYLSGLAFTIAIWDASTSSLVTTYSGTTTVSNTSTPGTAQTVPVNFSLPPGNYKIGFSSLASGNFMWMNTFFTSYPYTVVPNTISITGPQVSNYYEIFYNWSVISPVMSSPRVAVTATVYSVPDAGAVSATPASICSGSTTVLSESGSVVPPYIGATMSSYSWTGPSGYSSSATATSVGSVTVTPVSGYYSLTVTYPGTGCTSIPVSTYVTVNTATTPTITGTFSACVAASQTLSVTPTGGTWSSSNTSVATVDATTGVVTGVHAGTATISYLSPCGLTATQSFTVNPTPTAITGPSTICVTAGYPTYSVTVDGSSTGSWSASPLSVAVIGSSSGTLTSMSVGTANISYTTTSGCYLTTTLNVNNTGPSAITGGSSICSGGVTTLADATTGGVWSSADTTIATVNASTGDVTGVSAGTVTISYITGCTPHATTTVTVNGATVALSNSGPACTGSTLNMTATPSTSLTSYSWNGPNSYSSSSSLTPSIGSVTSNAAGTYTFTAVAGGCTTYTTMNVVVGVTPSVTATASPSAICSGGTSYLTLPTLSPSAYSVYSIPYSVPSFTPTGTLTSASTFTSTYDDGYYAVSLPSGFSFNFYGTSYSTVYINANGYITFGSGVSSGSATPLTLPSATAPSRMVALFWHDMNLSAGSITYGSTGTIPNRKFIISYNAVPDATDVNSGQIILYEGSNVIDMMVSHTNTGTKTCGVQNSGGTQALTPPGQNNVAYSVTGVGYQGWRFATPSYSYSWSPATALSSTAVSNPTSTGLSSTQVYSVSVVDAYSSCTSGASSNTTISVSPVPSISMTSSATSMCVGSAMTLTASSSGGVGTPTYTWSGPGITTTTGSTPTPAAFYPSVVSTTIGAYSVSVSYAASGCTTATASSTTDTIAPQPVVTVTPSATTLCSGDTLTLTETTTTGGVGSVLYTWSGPGITTTTGSSNISPAFTPTVSSGSYSVSVAYSGTGCTTATAATATVDMNGRPGITLGGSPSVCSGATSASISYSGAVNSPTNYSIDWSSAAITAGFANVTGATLSVGSIGLTVPGAVAAGSYAGTITVSNGSCTSTSYSFSLNVINHATAAITASTTPCMGYDGLVTITGTTGATIGYMVDSATLLTTTLTGGTYTVTLSAMSTGHYVTLVNVDNGTCVDYIDTVILISPLQMSWTGITDTDWNNAANWSCGFVPGSTDDVIIPSGTTYAPYIAASGSGSTKGITIASGVTLHIGSGGVLSVAGDLSNNGTIGDLGTLTMNGTSAQTISGFGVVNNFDLNNTAGATVSSGSLMTINKVLSVTNGVLHTGDSVVLASTSAGTARVASITASGANISGNVKTMQYVEGGYRRYRFWSHAFSNSIPLMQIQNYIDVTGDSGSVHGFVTTGSNAPSAFRYDPTRANSARASDPGWMPFTDCYGTADSNRLQKDQGIRLFIRGSKGQGLGYASYTPDSVNISMWGQLNVGPHTVTLRKGAAVSGQEYNMVGNPYASPVDIGTVIYNAKMNGNLVGSAFYVWNTSMGAAGQFQAITIANTPYYLQAYNAFQVRAAHNGDSLNFTESNKSSSATTNLFKANPDYISMVVYDANYHPWDIFNIKFDDAASDKEEDVDATKPSGTDFKFYSLSSDNQKLAIDVRDYKAGKVIPLGITSAYTQDFIIKVVGQEMAPDASLFLHDKLLEKYTLVAPGAEYRFSITADEKTQGEARFELVTGKNSGTSSKGVHVSVIPNPATEDVKISFACTQQEHVTVKVMDVTGVCVFEKDLGATANGALAIPLDKYASGVYMVEVTAGKEKVVQRLIKE